MIAIEIGSDVRNVRQCHFYLGGQYLFAVTRKISNLSFRKKELSMRERGVTPTLKASLNSIKLLSRYSNISRDRLLVHTYIPLYKMAFQIARTYTGKIYQISPQ